ncbi:GNAT family N-acetyltransferase [Galbibacter sp.]|uniref:GNAT family N-acetyltransferase n=1 Tax=Galbibacter sp. TaxID=2918471 RepID=UPI003A8EB2C0
MIFNTQRLQIRPLDIQDLGLFHKMQNDQEVMRYIGGKISSLAENKRDLETILKYYKDPDNDFWVWAIELIDTERFIGTIALVKNQKGEYEIGYRLLKDYWKKGYGKEVTNGVIKYAFEKLKLKEIVAYVDKENLTSVRILESTFNFIKEIYNEQDNCIDRYYKLSN